MNKVAEVGFQNVGNDWDELAGDIPLEGPLARSGVPAAFLPDSDARGRVAVAPSVTTATRDSDEPAGEIPVVRAFTATMYLPYLDTNTISPPTAETKRILLLLRRNLIIHHGVTSFNSSARLER